MLTPIYQLKFKSHTKFEGSIPHWLLPEGKNREATGDLGDIGHRPAQRARMPPKRGPLGGRTAADWPKTLAFQLSLLQAAKRIESGCKNMFAKVY